MLKNNNLYSDIKIGYVYILQEIEFIKTKEPIFKIGKTKQKIIKD